MQQGLLINFSGLAAIASFVFSGTDWQKSTKLPFSALEVTPEQMCDRISLPDAIDAINLCMLCISSL